MRFSSTLSPPFHSTSSSSHSSFISFTSSTTLRTVASLCTPPERVWTLDDSYFLSGFEPNANDLKETYVESYTESLTSPQFSKQGFSRTWSTMTQHSRICFANTCLSLPARRLVCWSVVVVRVRANGAIRWRAKRATCWTNWSGAKCCKCTD